MDKKYNIVSKELIIRSRSTSVDFALLKDGKLVEFHKEIDENKFNVGDIFLSKVKKTLSGLNAAFINVGYEKDAFLHYHDLGPKVSTLLKFTKRAASGKIKDYSLKKYPIEPEIKKDGVITDAIQSNQSILVQIIKEPISTKGPRVSSELSLAGRYLVLVPFSDRVSISQKISTREEKNRLKKLVFSIKPKGFGVIIRTVAEGKKVAELDKDLQDLFNRWVNMCKKIQNSDYPSRVLSELTRASSILRDIFDDGFTGIHVDDSELLNEVKDYLEQIAPNRINIVKLFKSQVPIFEHFGIERQIKSSFGRTVSMNRGAYLIVEHTEALHVIDVNSGNRSNKAKNQEDTALEVNMIAATEIARQLRLRDMGGIIGVDFIDMIKQENRKTLFEHFKSVMENDRAKHKILPPSKIGLIQMTRQRVRPEMEIKTSESNPNINGEVEAPIVLIDKIKSDLEKILSNPKHKRKKIVLHLHPFVAAYVSQGWKSERNKWYFNYKKWIKIIPRDAYTYLHYRFFDDKGKVIHT